MLGRAASNPSQRGTGRRAQGPPPRARAPTLFSTVLAAASTRCVMSPMVTKGSLLSARMASSSLLLVYTSFQSPLRALIIFWGGGGARHASAGSQGKSRGCQPARVPPPKTSETAGKTATPPPPRPRAHLCRRGAGVLGLQLRDELVYLRPHLAARREAALRAKEGVQQGGLDVGDGHVVVVAVARLSHDKARGGGLLAGGRGVFIGARGLRRLRARGCYVRFRPRQAAAREAGLLRLACCPPARLPRSPLRLPGRARRAGGAPAAAAPGGTAAPAGAAARTPRRGAAV